MYKLRGSVSWLLSLGLILNIVKWKCSCTSTTAKHSVCIVQEFLGYLTPSVDWVCLMFWCATSEFPQLCISFLLADMCLVLASYNGHGWEGWHRWSVSSLPHALWQGKNCRNGCQLWKVHFTCSSSFVACLLYVLLLDGMAYHLLHLVQDGSWDQFRQKTEVTKSKVKSIRGKEASQQCPGDPAEPGLHNWIAF